MLEMRLAASPVRYLLLVLHVLYQAGSRGVDPVQRHRRQRAAIAVAAIGRSSEHLHPLHAADRSSGRESGATPEQVHELTKYVSMDHTPRADAGFVCVAGIQTARPENVASSMLYLLALTSFYASAMHKCT